MKQYSRKVADSICQSSILSEIRGCFCESRATEKEYAEQTGPVGKADFGVPQQRPECQKLVLGKWNQRADLLQMTAQAV